MTRPRLEGTYTAIVTPFRTKRSTSPIDTRHYPINYNILDKYMQHVVSGPIQGIVIAGSTGSDSDLSEREQIQFVREIQRRYRDNLLKGKTIIAGCGSNCLDNAVNFTRRMAGETGVEFQLHKSPYVKKPNDADILHHFECVAKALELEGSGNLIVYDIPGRLGGKGVVPNIARVLAQNPRVAGFKAAAGLQRALATIEETKEYGLPVLSGDDSITPEIIEAGGRGVISVTSGIFPVEMCNLTTYALKGREKQAQRMKEKLTPIFNALFPTTDRLENLSPNPVTTHFALQELGFDVGMQRGSAGPSITERLAIRDAIEFIRSQRGTAR